MMPVRAVSTPNIALIKYWGNRNEEWRVPAAGSLSLTLDRPIVEVVVTPAEQFSSRSFTSNGIEDTLTKKEAARLEKHFRLVKKYLGDSAIADALPSNVSLEIRSKIPRGIGLASSAAVFSALAEAYAGFAKQVSRRDVSVLARLGSGSASRSVFGGFVAMRSGDGETIDTAYAEEIAPAHHWKLWDVILVPSHQEKATGSTEGHVLAHTSPLFGTRLEETPKRLKKCIEAIQQKDFETLQQVSEEDCLDMHAVMESSTPPLRYLSEETHRITSEVKKLRARENLHVLYTMDAGPTVHLICDESALTAVRAYATAQSGCTILEAGIGQGSHIL